MLSTKGTCTKIVGSSLGNSVKWPAMVLADLRSAAMRTDDCAVPGMIYATFVAGPGRPFSRPSQAHTEALGSSGAGAGAVILISPFRMTDSLGGVSKLVSSHLPTTSHWTCGAQATPTVTRGSIRDQVAVVVFPTA